MCVRCLTCGHTVTLAQLRGVHVSHGEMEYLNQPEDPRE
jgi:hypothetical protein